MYKSKGIPHPTLNRKDWMEKHLISQRNREEAQRQQWDSTSKYFKTCQVKTSKYAHLSSPEIYQQSMEAYHLREIEREREKQFDGRIINSKFENDLRNARVQAKLPQNIPLRFYTEETSRRRVVPKIEVENVEDEEPPLTRIPNISKDRGDVASSDDARQMDSKGQNTCDLPRLRCPLTSSDPTPPTVQPPPPIPLNEMIQRVQNSERESSNLKREHAELWRYLQALRDRFMQRATVLKDQDQVCWRNSWIRPYKVQIQLRGRHVIEAMELDTQLLTMLQTILKRVVKDDELLEKLENVKLKMKEDREREKERLWGVENLFQEEAERLWFVQSADWDKEEQVRDTVVQQCVKLVESKLQSRISENLERQQSNINSRETLLNQMT